MPQQFISINPADESIVKKYPLTTTKQVERKIKTASVTFSEWRRLSFVERGAVLQKIASQLRLKAEELAHLATVEMGKPIQQGREEAEKCAKVLEYYAENADHVLRDKVVASDASRSYVTYQPLGAILAIMPWNFPFWQVFRAFAPMAMAGNVMLLKHASNVSGCAMAIEDIVNQSGAPIGILQSLLVPSAAVGDLIANQAIKGVTLTGSTEAGRSVASIAGRCLKRQVLELGGSDAYIVLEDADIESAATICVNGRLKNSGQSCVAAKRFIFAGKNIKAFEQAMTLKMQSAKWGDPLEAENVVGPMARVDLRNQLHEQVLASIAKGAKLLCGGYIPDKKGAWYPPTVLTRVKKGMPAYHEELFGPVAAIIAAKGQEAAISIANDSQFGLGGAVLSSNIARAEDIARNDMEVGSCFINDFVHSDQRLPFGGVKDSGYGRELGENGLFEFVNIKTIYIK